MLLITSILCFTACSGDNKEERPNIPTSRYMKVGEDFNLGYQSDWVSSNTFAATVDNMFAAGYLLKAGVVAEKLGQNEKALGFYETIQDKYPQSMEAYEIGKYIARVENK